MITAFSFHSRDVAQLHNLLAFVHELGDCKKHSAVLVADAATPYAECAKARKLALQCFGQVYCISNGASVKGWPQGPNSLFWAAAKYIEGMLAESWLWMETDCVPLKANWLDALESEYAGLTVPMGDLYHGLASDTGLPMRAVSGIAVYPPNAASVLVDDPKKPWDMANREWLLQNAVATPLIKHLYGQKDLPPTFVAAKSHDSPKNAFTLDEIRSQAVLFHRNKDGTLIELLRKRLNVKREPPNILYANAPKGGDEKLNACKCKMDSTMPIIDPECPFHGHAAAAMGLQQTSGAAHPIKQPRESISIRRSMALGDCVAASFLADQLKSMGKTVEWQSKEYCHSVLHACPSVASVTVPHGTPDINLDGCYEYDPARNSIHFAKAFHTRAVQNLLPHGIQMPPCVNFAPRLVHKPSQRIQELFARHARPWIVISPRSNGFVTRMVPDTIWSMVASQVIGTCFWLGNHGPAPKPIVDLSCKTVGNVMDGIVNADFFLGIDSGPMHIAAALGKPGVVIHQSSNPELHLSDQRDFSVFSPPLDCLDCNKRLCPRGLKVPECQHIDPNALAAEVNRRLGVFDLNRIAAVVCVYKPDPAKLTRCLDALAPQVNEIIVSGDQATPNPFPRFGGKIRFVRSWQRDIGYGRKANYGMKQTSAGWVMLVNDDVYLNPDTVAKLHETAMKDKRIGVIGHLLRYPDGKVQHGGVGRRKDGLDWMHLDYKAAQSRFNTIQEMEFVTGASIMVRREAFYKAFGFDERFYLYCEDNDLCMKIRQLGYRVAYHPSATGIHEESQSTRLTPRIQEITQNSVRYFHLKWDNWLKQGTNLPRPLAI